MIVTSHPLAVEEGARVLADGGNAVEAAVAAAAVLCVVEPMSVGLGGDLFAMVWEPQAARPLGLASAGWAGSKARPIAGRNALGGPSSVTVPGAVAGWKTLLDRYGALGRERILEPAVDAAVHGYEVTPAIAEMWRQGLPRLQPEAAKIFTRSGRAPEPGDRMYNLDLGQQLGSLAADGLGAFYEEEMAERVIAAIGTDGHLEREDIINWPGADWVDVLSGTFSGLQIYEMPPPGQGATVLEALALYSSIEEEIDDRHHALIESTKLALEDAATHVCDPLFGPAAQDIMLRASHIEERCKDLSLREARYTQPPGGAETVFIATVDARGMACSLIQSIYDSFGSGIVVPGTGILLQNRGSNFRLDPAHKNVVAPRKRPLHTILPAMIGRGSSFHASFGIVGGFMQPQGQLQILQHLLENGASPAEALAAPRWRVTGGRDLSVEDGFGEAVLERLARKGHELARLPKLEAGGGQLIVRSGDALHGATDPRLDGAVQRV